VDERSSYEGLKYEGLVRVAFRVHGIRIITGGPGSSGLYIIVNNQSFKQC